jgi:hypothetical protein
MLAAARGDAREEIGRFEDALAVCVAHARPGTAGAGEPT